MTKSHDEEVRRWREHFEGLLNCDDPGNMLRGPGRLRGYRGAGNRQGRCEQRGDTACDQEPEEREGGRKRQNMSRDDKAWGRGNAGTTNKTMQQGVEIGKGAKEVEEWYHYTH